MDEEHGTQREIAKSYRDRVQARFTRTISRRTRFLLSVLFFAGGVVAIYYCEKTKPQEFFNTGPLSRSHVYLKDGCASCHVPERLTGSSPENRRDFSGVGRSIQKGRAIFRKHRSRLCEMSSTARFPRA
jgi:hypothetical protein